MRSLFVSILVATSCVAHGPATKIPAPTLEGNDLVLSSTGGGMPSLILRAAWERRGDRYCVRDELVTLVTRAGSIPFDKASLCITDDPVSIEGEAWVTIPGLGLLGAVGLDVQPRRARLKIALGSQFKSLIVNGRKIEPNPYHYYIFAHYQDGLSVSLGNLSVKAPATASGTIVFAPQDPFIYLGGAVMAPFVPVGVSDAAIGLSPQGRFVFKAKQQLQRGNANFSPRLNGHLLLAGALPLTPHPVTIHGEVLFDVDANKDGVTVFSGHPRDFQIGANGELVLGYNKNGFDFEFTAGSASVHYDARPGRGVHFAAGDAGGLFQGTPLAMFEPDRKVKVHGFFSGENRFGIYAETKTKVLGFGLGTTAFALDNNGISARARLTLPARIGGVDVQGKIGPRGGFSLRGKADLRLAKLRLLKAAVTLSNKGVRAAGKIKLPGLGSVQVSGAIRNNGKFSLSGRGTLKPAGVKLSNALVSVSPTGAKISGAVNLFGTGFNVSGKATSRAFDLSGQVNLNLLLFKGKAKASIGNRRGVRVSVSGQVCLLKGPCKTIAGMELDAKGRICPTFPVVGRKCIKVFKKRS